MKSWKLDIWASIATLSSLAIIYLSFSAGGSNWQAPAPIYLGAAPFALHFDALSSVFTLLLGLVSLSSALFSPGYLSHTRINRYFYWICFLLFVAGMLVVVLSANAITFLVAWEIMSLSSAVLVASEFTSHKAQKAGIIYLGATRLATAFIAGGFLWLHLIFGSWDFSQWHLTTQQALMPSLMVAAGLCVKAGIWPFHLWLPYAHPMAPSPISALMSAVMIKVPLYVLIRLLLMDGHGSQMLGAIFVLLGAISSVWGILFAFVEHDIKKVLAYSTVENAGLILLSTGVCLFAQSANLNAVAVLAFIAALFHSINHALFKSLLFLGAGTVVSSAHSKELDRLGGLARRLPVTAFCFMIGVLSAASLPPLNGFASKWLIYQSLFGAASTSTDKTVIAASLGSIGVLALVGGLSLAVFAKLFALSFLGRARTRAAGNAIECSPLMRFSQLTLAAAAVLAGLLSPHICRELARIFPGEGADLVAAAPYPAITFLLIAGLSLILYVVFLDNGAERIRRYVTWECGYGKPSQRMQISAESFSHAVGIIFSPLLQYVVRSEIGGRDRRHFPEQIKAEPVMVSLLESRVYGPLIRSVRFVSEHLLRLQTGSIHLYLLYVFVVLVLILIAGVSI